MNSYPLFIESDVEGRLPLWCFDKLSTNGMPARMEYDVTKTTIKTGYFNSR